MLGDQALLCLGNPLLPLSLHGQSPATHDGAIRHMIGQTLLKRQRYRCLRPVLDQLPLTAALMEHRGKEQSINQIEGVRQRTGQGERRLAPLQGLLRIAQQPQHQGRKGEAKYSGVREAMGAVLLGIIEGTALGQMLLGRDKLSKVLKRLAERPMCLHEERRVANALGQTEEPLSQLSRCLVLCRDEMKLPQSHQRYKELWCLSHLSAQLKCPAIDDFHFRSPIALDEPHRWAKGGLQEQLVLSALGGVRQR